MKQKVALLQRYTWCIRTSCLEENNNQRKAREKTLKSDLIIRVSPISLRYIRVGDVNWLLDCRWEGKYFGFAPTPKHKLRTKTDIIAVESGSRSAWRRCRTRLWCWELWCWLLCWYFAGRLYLDSIVPWISLLLCRWFRSVNAVPIYVVKKRIRRRNKE